MSKTKSDLEKELSEAAEDLVARGRRVKALELEIERLTQQTKQDAAKMEKKSLEIFRLKEDLADTACALKLAARLNSSGHERQRAKTGTIHTHWRYVASAGDNWITAEKED